MKKRLGGNRVNGQNESIGRDLCYHSGFGKEVQ